jgi:hypothetical protein
MRVSTLDQNPATVVPADDCLQKQHDERTGQERNRHLQATHAPGPRLTDCRHSVLGVGGYQQKFRERLRAGTEFRGEGATRV